MLKTLPNQYNKLLIDKFTNNNRKKRKIIEL